MKKVYQVVSQSESAEVREFLEKHGHALHPVIELIASGKQAINGLIAELGKAALEAVLQVSANEVAGPPHPGVPGGAIRRHGSQRGVVVVGSQKVRVEKPRLRRKEGGEGAEVSVPAYATLQEEARMGKRVRAIVMRGVSTRHYEEVLPELAGRCGVSRSAVSREFCEASAESLEELCERHFEELDLPIVYIDGKHFGGHQVICAVGVDREGRKHVLGITEGATENAVVVKELLEGLVERAVRPGRKRLFVIRVPPGREGLASCDRCRLRHREFGAALPGPQAEERLGLPSPRAAGPGGTPGALWARRPGGCHPRRDWRACACRSSGWSIPTRGRPPA